MISFKNINLTQKRQFTCSAVYVVYVPSIVPGQIQIAMLSLSIVWMTMTKMHFLMASSGVYLMVRTGKSNLRQVTLRSSLNNQIKLNE